MEELLMTAKQSGLYALAFSTALELKGNKSPQNSSSGRLRERRAHHGVQRRKNDSDSM